ncbi:MAG: extracellular solute-binding protein, partial [Prevotella sp.]|nr:extracellular solute-binding protein [Prevotella sp.]
MKEKICVSVLILMAVSAFVFASATKDQDVTSGTEKITLGYSFWGSPDAIGVEADIIAAFEKKYPNLKVEPNVTGYGDYHTKLLTMIAGGSAPDVMRISTNFLPDFVASKGVVNIDKMAKDHNFDLSIYYKEGLNDCSWEGVCYG